MRLTKHLRECFVRAVFNDVPTPVKPSVADVQAALYEGFHPLIKAVFDNEETRKHLNGSYYHVTGVNGAYVKTAGQETDKLPIVIAANNAFEARQRAMVQLRAVAEGCTNLKQLQESLPELIKYMVSEEKPTPVNLPAITGTVDALKALGWKS